MRTLLVCQTESANKFWEIDVTGTSFVVTWGKIGTAGQMKIKEFKSEEDCQKEAGKQIRSKLKKGYVEKEAPEEWFKKSAMNEEEMWTLFQKAKTKGEDIEEQMEWLVTVLSRKSVIDLVRFEEIFNEVYNQSYTSDLWAAAYIVMGGCSDDLFDYFRAWLLYQGKDIYYAAIKEPETIIPSLENTEKQGEMPELEDLLFLAVYAFEEKTGLEDEHFYRLQERLGEGIQEQPDIELDWEEEEDQLRRRFPMLWGKYGNCPLEYK
ncbi:DUF4240 domain-containing protein [Domibacillus sp.]|uniref:DUF4240 domain-containing protein n=1 Tax=Domibacillus sp. TaxID=1969783 RepID=UPI002811290C|nr:DUF4240 domain-containing protein [Domibacillus sp.]